MGYKIIITVHGGIVTDVYTDINEKLDVQILDYAKYFLHGKRN